MTRRWLEVPMKQSVLVDDTECLDGQSHTLDGRPYGNDPVYCGKCARRLWATANHPTWYARRRAYWIEEESW